MTTPAPAAAATPLFAWALLFVAGLLEIAWAIGLKKSEGFTRPLTTAVTVVLMILSFICLARALKWLPVGTGYAVWTGIGTVGAAIAGMVLFNEPRTAARLFFIGLIVTGIIGLKAFTR